MTDEPDWEDPWAAAPAPDFRAYRLRPDAPEMVPAEALRGWMDATPHRFIYRCIPMTVANASGWELLCPYAFTARWTGGRGLDAIKVEAANPEEAAQVAAFASSHFGEGILTMQPGYLFRTAPGWAVWVRGAPNHPSHGLFPLEGIVETDWLPFSFTMNWRFTAPGEVRFQKGDRFCFLTPVPHTMLGEVEPVIRDIADEPDLQARFKDWSASRNAFNKGLVSGDAETVKQGWQRHYAQGDARGGDAPSFHLSKRRMKPPKIES